MYTRVALLVQRKRKVDQIVPGLALLVQIKNK